MTTQMRGDREKIQEELPITGEVWGPRSHQGPRHSRDSVPVTIYMLPEQMCQATISDDDDN